MRSPTIETGDRIYKLYGWPQTFVIHERKGRARGSSAAATAAVGIVPNRLHRTDPVFMSGPDGGYVAAVAQGRLLVFMSG